MVRGFPVVLSSPSGGGKTTVAGRILKTVPYLRRSRSTTTRAPRAGETPGREYEFVSDEEFDHRTAKGEFAEWARVHAHRYGTGRAFLEATCAAGDCPLLVIDVQGARSIRRACPDAVLVFLMPPSLAQLEGRLRERASEAPGELALRLANARGEIAAAVEYDYTVVNEALPLAVEHLRAVLERERAARASSPPRA